jgi:hypothetical protein
MVGFALLLLHNLDEAFVHPESGGRVSLVGTAVLAVLVVVLYRRLGRWWRAAMTGLLGLLATLQGFTGHVWHVVVGGAAPLDYSGILYLLGGLVLLSTGIAEARGPHAPPLVS